MATPSSTAYCSGIARVPRKVITMTTRGTRPVCQTVRRAAGLIDRKPTTRSSAARAGMAMSFTRSAASRTIAAMSTPQEKLAQRERAPALTTSAVPEIEAPDGMPWKKLVATFAAPCPRKSPEGFGNLPSGLG